MNKDTRLGEYSAIEKVLDKQKDNISKICERAISKGAQDCIRQIQYDLPEGFCVNLGCTIRTCIGCGCLVSGGPTRCVRCAKKLDLNWIQSFFHRILGL